MVISSSWGDRTCIRRRYVEVPPAASSSSSSSSSDDPGGDHWHERRDGLMNGELEEYEIESQILGNGEQKSEHK